MKAAKYLYVCIFFIGFGGLLQAQQPNTSITQGAPGSTVAPQTEPIDVYERMNITDNKKPIPYGHLREADVMWSKDIWRLIDLRERMNHPLRYPEDEPMYLENRYSLYQLLFEGIKSGEVTPYGAQRLNAFRNPFSEPMTVKEVYRDLASDTIFGDNMEVQRVDIKSNYVKAFYIKEKWYFDNKHSEMRVRINVMAPVLYLPKYDEVTGQQLPGVERKIAFFVYFPECRNLFAQHPVFNPNNDAQNLSFDDLFIQRRFASTIAAESNEFENRFITDYLQGQDALMESERIKGELFIMEHDLWEF